MERTPEQESLEVTSKKDIEGADVTCWPLLGQTVPSAGSCNREGLITYSGQPCTMDREEVELSCLRFRNHWSSSARYDGAIPGSIESPKISNTSQACSIQTVLGIYGRQLESASVGSGFLDETQSDADLSHNKTFC